MIEFLYKRSELAELYRQRRIEAVLYDLDDTLIHTSELFRFCMETYVATVCIQTGLDPQTVLASLQAINDQEYRTKGVNPARWSSVIERMALLYPNHCQAIIQNKDLLLQIYHMKPRIRAGACAILSQTSRAGVKQALVTHANVEWTNRKLSQLGLWSHFQTIVIADENGHKSSLDWQTAINGLDLNPSHCLVVGDNLSGDIIPAVELGARAIWMPSPWSVYRQGSVPPGVVTINDLTDFPEAVEKLQ